MANKSETAAKNLAVVANIVELTKQAMLRVSGKTDADVSIPVNDVMTQRILLRVGSNLRNK